MERASPTTEGGREDKTDSPVAEETADFLIKCNSPQHEVRYPLPDGRGKGVGPWRAAHFFCAAPQNFDAWRQKPAPGAKVPHPALSRPGEGVNL